MGIFKRLSCPHSDLEGIYGDNIHAYNGRRLRCMDCGSALDGPVVLVKMREDEKDA